MPFIGEKPRISGLDRKCVGGAEIRYRYHLLRLRFTLKKTSEPMLFYQFDYYRCFPVIRALPVARYLRKSDHFVVQHISNALEKRFGPLNMLNFPPIRAQKSARLKNRQTNIIFIKSKLFI